MRTISPAKINAKIAFHENEIEWLKSLLDPKRIEALADLAEDSEPESDEEDEPKVDETEEASTTGKYGDMRPSDATFAFLNEMKPGTAYRIRGVFDHLIENGLLIGGDPRYAFKNYTIGIGQDKRLKYDRVAKSISLSK